MKNCLSCARCGVRYCRQSCQKDDWVVHKAVCRRSNKDEVIGEHTISVSEVLQGLRYASMLLLFNPESRPLARLRIMTQRLDLRGMASGSKENGCSPSQTLNAHWQPLRFHEAHSSTIVCGGLDYNPTQMRTERLCKNGAMLAQRINVCRNTASSV